MDDGAMAHGDVIADVRRMAARAELAVVRDMDDRAVLDVGALADADDVDVAAQHALRPDRTLRPDGHVADDRGGRIDIRVVGEIRIDVFERADAHCRCPPLT
ncbi:MAG: hypothetical protein U5K73_11835 [Halofilum sp. (in: g-proteobacteria)]|nr:hypothetical protein [Halofilum sp. (in: g-proteobacteria)]